MRQRVANHKGRKDWQDCGPRQPAPVGPMGEKHTRYAGTEDEATYGIYFSTPGHRPMMTSTHTDIETGYGR